MLLYCADELIQRVNSFFVLVKVVIFLESMNACPLQGVVAIFHRYVFSYCFHDLPWRYMF
ncbi:hypothetical protein KR49_06495 [Synechococcus sp. KORDI-49]|nr:hypothetical protein KR49_06495 [Synechococcus sp. KORDI-49]